MTNREIYDALEDTADTAVAHKHTLPQRVFMCHGCVSRADASQDVHKLDRGTRHTLPQRVFVCHGCVSRAVASQGHRSFDRGTRHEVTLTVHDVDEFGVTKQGVGVASVIITVVDDEPPIALVTTNIGSLWPANKSMVPVTILLAASDLCTDPNDLEILCAVSSNQADDTGGTGQWTGDVDGHDGYSAPVAVTLLNTGPGMYTASLNLRAERDPAVMAGRTYSITVLVMDGTGNIRPASTTVVVPHNGKKN